VRFLREKIRFYRLRFVYIYLLRLFYNPFRKSESTGLGVDKTQLTVLLGNLSYRLLATERVF
jgi:hypothetical protein